MKKFFLWQYMLNKRLLHKREFIILLCMIPILVWSMRMISKEDSGVVTIALSVEDAHDELAGRIVEEMTEEDSIIKYVFADIEQAYEMVREGKVDCAWIFRQDFQNKLVTTFSSGSEKDAPVYVVAQEDTVALQLARTKLYGYIFPHLAYLLSENYIETEFLDGQEASREMLSAAYEKSAVEGSLFHAIYVEPDDMSDYSEAATENEEPQNSYLMTPVRGLLIVLIIIAGLVVTMYFLQDGERGMFAWIPVCKRRGLLYSYIMAATLDTSIVVLLALLISEGSRITLRELVALVIYLPVTAVFCEFVKILCRTKDNLAKCIPLFAIAMLALCPVFLDLGSGFVLQYIFPPTYYLRCLYDYKMIIGMVVYAGVLFIIGTIYHKLIELKK